MLIGRTSGRTDALTDGQPENIMPPTHLSVGGGIKSKLIANNNSMSTEALCCVILVLFTDPPFMQKSSARSSTDTTAWQTSLATSTLLTATSVAIL